MTRERKVAYIVSGFPVITERFIYREIEELIKRGIDIYIFSLKNANEEKKQKDSSRLLKHTYYSSYFLSLRLIKSNLYFFFFYPLKYVKIIAYIIKQNIRNPKILLMAFIIFPKTIYFSKIIKEKNIRHIHAHWATIPTTSALIISEMLNINFSFTAHAWDIFVDQTMLEEKIRKSSFVVTCTNYNKKFLQKCCSVSVRNKIYLNYHGLDLNRCKPKKFTPKGNIIVSGGRLVEKKGLNYLIKACEILKDRNLRFQCIIIGQGAEEGKLRDMITKFVLQDYITLGGNIHHNRVMNLLTEANLCVLPCITSKNNDMDGIPNILVEAMAVGTPIVSTNISAIPELVKDQENGLLVPQKDSLMLADAIQTLLIDLDLQRIMGLKGRETVQKMFNIENNIDKLAGLFEKKIFF